MFPQYIKNKLYNFFYNINIKLNYDIKRLKNQASVTLVMVYVIVTTPKHENFTQKLLL